MTFDACVRTFPVWRSGCTVGTVAPKHFESALPALSSCLMILGPRAPSSTLALVMTRMCTFLYTRVGDDEGS